MAGIGMLVVVALALAILLHLLRAYLEDRRERRFEEKMRRRYGYDIAQPWIQGHSRRKV